MGKIKPILKYDLNTNEWKKDITEEDKKTAFSIASYKEIKNNDSNIFDYIIYCDGFRVENVSDDMETIKASKNGVDKIIKFFKNSDRNIVIKTILIDKDAPLEKQSKLLSNYINEISKDKKINSINILGHSKCGAMVFSMAKYLDNDSKKKVNIFTTSTPFLGTLLASPKYFNRKVKEVIKSVIKDEYLSNEISSRVIGLYENICSNSHMDYDIAIKDGVYKSKYDKYDSKFLENIFSKENIEAIKSVNFYQNFTTKINEETLIESIKTFDLTGIGLCLLNKFIMDNNSDGFVKISSQKVVDDYLNIKSYHLNSHHFVFSNERVANKILKFVNKNIN